MLIEIFVKPIKYLNHEKKNRFNYRSCSSFFIWL